MNTIKKLMTLAAVLLCGGAWAAIKPVAIWQAGTIDTMQGGTVNFNIAETGDTKGNTLNDDGSVTIVKRPIQVSINNPFPCNDGYTLLVKYSGFTAGTAKQTLAAARINTDDLIGLYTLNTTGTLAGIWNNGTWSTTAGGEGVLPSSGTFAFAAKAEAGAHTKCYAMGTDATTAIQYYNGSGLWGSDRTFYGFVIGGMTSHATSDTANNNLVPMTGLTVSAIAVFENKATATDLQSFVWPSGSIDESNYSATIASGNVAWPNLGWDTAWQDNVYSSVAKITVSGTATIDVSSDVSAKRVEIDIAEGATLTLKSSNSSVITMFDKLYVTGKGTIHFDGATGEFKAVGRSSGTTVILDLAEESTMEIYKNNTWNYGSSNFAGVSGKGTIKLSGTNWQCIPSASAIWPLTHPVINNLTTGGMILKDGNTTYTMANYSGTGDVSTTNGSGARNLTIIQSEDLTWSGTLAADGTARFGTFTVQGSGEHKTLTYTGNNSSKQAGALTVDASGSMKMNGTWKAKNTVAINGEFGGSGSVTDATTIKVAAGAKIRADWSGDNGPVTLNVAPTMGALVDVVATEVPSGNKIKLFKGTFTSSDVTTHARVFVENDAYYGSVSIEEDGVYTTIGEVPEELAVAKVDGTSYITIGAAINAAKAVTGTVTLVKASSDDIEIPANVTVDPASYAFTGTVSGSGTIISYGSTTAAPAVPSGVAANTWAGTVWLKNKSDWTYIDLDSYGNSKSTVRLTGITGHLTQNADVSTNVELKDETNNGNTTVALKIKNGWSSNIIVLQHLKGDGTLEMSEGPVKLLVKDWDDFTGTAKVSGTGFAGLIFGNVDKSTVAVGNNSVNDKKITILSGNTVEISGGKTWSATSGVHVAGTITGSGAIGSNLVLTDAAASVTVASVTGTITTTVDGKQVKTVDNRNNTYTYSLFTPVAKIVDGDTTTYYETLAAALQAARTDPTKVTILDGTTELPQNYYYCYVDDSGAIRLAVASIEYRRGFGTIASAIAAATSEEVIHIYADSSEALALPHDVIFDVAAEETFTLSGVISGGYSITKTGSGTLQMITASTFTGGLNVNEGTVKGADTLTQASWSNQGNGVFGKNTNRITVAAGATLDYGASISWDGYSITSAGVIDKSGSGSTDQQHIKNLTVNGATTISGANTIGLASRGANTLVFTGDNAVLTVSNTSSDGLFFKQTTISGSGTIAIAENAKVSVLQAPFKVAESANIVITGTSGQLVFGSGIVPVVDGSLTVPSALATIPTTSLSGKIVETTNNPDGTVTYAAVEPAHTAQYNGQSYPTLALAITAAEASGATAEAPAEVTLLLSTDTGATIPANVLVKTSKSVQLSGEINGAGVVEYDYENDTNTHGAFTLGNSWTGTVWVKNLQSGHINPSAYCRGDSEGRPLSTIRMTDMYFWLLGSESAHTRVEAVNDANGKAFGMSSVQSNEKHTFAAITGSGNFNLVNSARSGCVVFESVEGFSGGVTANHPVYLGITGVDTFEKSSNDKIFLAQDTSITLASTATWTAANGITINGTIGGSGTLASAVTFGETGKLNYSNGYLKINGAITGPVSFVATPAFGTKVWECTASSKPALPAIAGETSYCLMYSGNDVIVSEKPTGDDGEAVDINVPACTDETTGQPCSPNVTQSNGLKAWENTVLNIGGSITEGGVLKVPTVRGEQSSDVGTIKLVDNLGYLSSVGGWVVVERKLLVGNPTDGYTEAKILGADKDATTIENGFALKLPTDGEKVKYFRMQYKFTNPQGAGVNPAVLPTPKIENDSYDWYGRHQKVLDNAKTINPDFVLIGDSITHYWCGWPQKSTSVAGPISSLDTDANSFFTTHFGGKAIDLGFGYDRIQNMIWRMQNGELENMNPKYVVIMAGTNNQTTSTNFKVASTADEIAEGIKLLVAVVQDRFPEAKIAIMGILPRTDVADATALSVNSTLSTYYADKTNCTFIDMWDDFKDRRNGQPNSLYRDRVHISDAAYDIWARHLKNDAGFPVNVSE